MEKVKILLPALVVCLILTGMCHAASDICRNLEGYWNLDEGSGTTVLDSSWQLRKGSLVDEPDWTTGILGDALDFNGISDYVEITHSNSLYFGESFTVSCWVKTTLPNAWQPFVTKHATYGWFLGGYNTTPDSVWILRDTAGADDLPGTADIDDDEWHHIVGTYDEATATRKLYVDGQLDASMENDTGPVTSNTAPVRLAMYESSLYHNGLIDEVAIWSRVLDVNEIGFLYNDGLANRVPHFVSWRRDIKSTIYNTYENAYAPKIIELSDSNWLCVWDGADVNNPTKLCISKSTDEGKEWRYLSQVSNEPSRSASTGELLQLANGDILCAYRVGTPSDPNVSIKIAKSTDNGASWAHLTTVMDWGPGVGVWEPDLLLKNDANLLMFYVREVYPQMIEMRKSTDNGATWGPERLVAGDMNSTDSTPVSVVLDNDDIVVVFAGEDDVNDRSTIMQVTSTDGGDNWSAREVIYNPHEPNEAYAPYITKLTSGELVMSCHTDETGDDGYLEAVIQVSYDDANTWHRQPRPFDANDGDYYWLNSLFVPDSNTIVVATTTNEDGFSGLKVLKGSVQFFDTQPEDQIVDASGTAQFTAGIVDPATYQWYKDGSALSNGGDISGADTNTVSISNVETADEGDYHCVATNGSSETRTSESAKLIVKRLISHWKLDGNANDFIAGGNNGVAVGDPNWITGKDGSAVCLDNDSGFQYIRIDDSNDYKLNEFSVSGWIKIPNQWATTGAGGWNQFIAFNNNDGGWGLGRWDENDYCGMIVRTPDAGGAVATTVDVNDNLWHHIVSTWDEAAETLKIYVDNDLKATETVDSGAINYFWDTPLVIGGRLLPYGYIEESDLADPNMFLGGGSAIDDVRIYNYAISPNDVNELYNEF